MKLRISYWYFLFHLCLGVFKQALEGQYNQELQARQLNQQSLKLLPCGNFIQKEGEKSGVIMKEE